MASVAGPSKHIRTNVLTLDGGGVRGLSTLLILRALMEEINQNIRKVRGQEANEQDKVEPHDIFDLVAGTSTGGLIAIMLGKMGLTVEQCIEAYHDLAGTVFGKKHIRARTNGGLAPSKYSGSRLRNCVRALLNQHHFEEDLPMSSDENRDKIACALICREHKRSSRYSDFKSGPVFICSLPCPDTLGCLVCDAARATSAAPTFFPAQKIDGRCFADGGLEFNNPSHAIFDHYTVSIRVAESRRTSVLTEGSIVGQHEEPDFSQVRFVNLGTGTEPTKENLRRQSRFARFAFLIPGAVRMILFLKDNLKKMAVNAENIAAHMESLALVSGDRFCIKYDRLSADNGVCFVEMDKFKKLPLIEKLTMEYLKTPKVERKLERMGRDIARDYLCKSHQRQQGEPSTLSVPPTTTRRPQISVPVDEFESSSSNTKQSSGEGATTPQSFVREDSPSGQKSDMIAGPVIIEQEFPEVVSPVAG